MQWTKLGSMRGAVWLLLLMLVACGGGSPATAQPPLDANAVVDKLSTAGLPIGDRMTYTAANDTNQLLGRPGQYVSKTSFRDTRITDQSADVSLDDGGSVETFATADDAKRRFDYIDGISKSPLFAEYHWLRGTTLLRVSHKLTPDQAKEYETALMKV
jgi:hypothetical protein